jgi:biopolymer transport protein ExbD
MKQFYTKYQHIQAAKEVAVSTDAQNAHQTVVRVMRKVHKWRI